MKPRLIFNSKRDAAEQGLVDALAALLVEDVLRPKRKPLLRSRLPKPSKPPALVVIEEGKR